MEDKGKKAISPDLDTVTSGGGDSREEDSSNGSSPDASENQVIGDKPLKGLVSVRSGRLFGAEKIQVAPLWIGRDDLLTTIKNDLINGCQVLALCGQRGIGKTSLAVKLLEACGVGITDKTLAVDCPFDRVVYVQVSEQMSFDSVIEDLAEWLPISLKPGLTPDQLISSLIARLKRSRCLIVLDNLEALLKVEQTVSEQWGKLLRALVNSDYKSQILITNLNFSNNLFELNNSNDMLNLPRVKVHPVKGLSRDDSVRLLRAKGLEDSDEDLYWVADQTNGHVGALLFLSDVSKSKYSGFLRKNQSIVTKHINTFNDDSVDIANSKNSEFLRIQHRFKNQKSRSLRLLSDGFVSILQGVHDRLEWSKSVLNLVLLRIYQEWKLIVNSIVVFSKLTPSVLSKQPPTWMTWTSRSIVILEVLGIVGFQYYSDSSIQIQDKKLREQTEQFERDLKLIQQLKKDLNTKNYANVLAASLPRENPLRTVAQRLQDAAKIENRNADLQLKEAQTFLEKRDIQASVDKLKEIPKYTDSYDLAQKIIKDINQKKTKTFQEAQALEKEDKFDQALRLLKEIPQGISISESAQKLRDRIKEKMGNLINLPPPRIVPDLLTRPQNEEPGAGQSQTGPNPRKQEELVNPAPPAPYEPVEPPVQKTPNQQISPDPPRDTREPSGFGE